MVQAKEAAVRNKKFNKKLTLKKTTVAHLGNLEMRTAHGGGIDGGIAITPNCGSSPCNEPSEAHIVTDTCPSECMTCSC
jgi:hypothetical protein